MSLVLDMSSKTQTSLKNEARRLSDERWRAAFENSAIGIMMADVNGRLFAANRVFRNMLGYSEKELYQLTFLDITYEEDRHNNLKLVRELVEGKRRHFQIEKRYRCKDGALLWVRSNATLVPGEDGKQSFWFNVVEDITDRKRMEDELRLQIDRLRETETRLQAFFDNSPNLIFLKDRQGRYVYANRQFKKALRVTDEQIKGKRDDELFLPEQAAVFQTNDRRVFEARAPMEFEEMALQENGQHTSIVHKFPLFNGQGEIYAIGGIVTDITERRKEESARHSIEQRYRVMVETASDAVVCMDENGAILLANPATARVFGYEPAELTGKPLTVLMPEFLRKMHESGLRRYLATGQRHINWQGTELTGLRKNGQEFPVEISFGEVTADGHRIFTGFVRDISERKQAEELRASLQATQLELAQVSRLTTMGELAASIAHEVNQPLTAVTNNANACLRLLANSSLDPEVLRQVLEEIVSDGNRASAVLARIRAFIKKGPAVRQEVDINDVIQEVLALVGLELRKNRISVERQLTKTLPHVLADRVQLQQVLLNLIMNAVEAMAVVTDGRRMLSVQSQVDESGDVMVMVRDSGTGLGSEGDRVFNPFFTTKSNGMGMGLPISRSLVESHGGRLWATPNSPHGAIFSLTLPAAAGSPP
jgi:PAS domain S-box-containing protein